MINETESWVKERLKNVQKFSGYKMGEDISVLADKLDLQPKEILKLDANENFFIPRTLLSDFIKEIADETDIRIYPQKDKDLIKELSEYTGIPPECIVLGNGADQLIDSFVRIFMAEGKEALSVKPTFSMYRIAVSLHGNKYIEVSLNDDFSLNIDKTLSTVTTNTTLFFLCSPNSPTGIQFKSDTVKKILEDFKGIFVVDETYAEFGEYTVLPMLRKNDNLVVLRSFSKSFGLASLRLGYAIASPEIIDCVKRVQPPYNVNNIAVELAIKLLNKVEIVKDAIERLREERISLISKLNCLNGILAFDSDANFILFQTERESAYVHKELVNQGIIVRKFDRVLNLKNCLRTTVGLPEMNKRLLDALEQICGR